MNRLLSLLLPLAFLCTYASETQAAPEYHQTILEYIFPAGGAQGTTVTVDCYGAKGGLEGATGIVMDGPPGVTVKQVESVSAGQVRATLEIAADAEPGPRMLRVRGGLTGLTNFRWFLVGTLPEVVEKEPNHQPEQAEEVQLPAVVNGRIRETLDLDCFRFRGQAGQKLVAAVRSHRLDAMSYGRGAGYFDANLELLDADGRVLAEAGDVLGFDPLIHFTVPEDGQYIARVSGLGYKGFPQAVYRLTLGEVEYPTAVFPPGGKRGETIEVELSGPNVSPAARHPVAVADGRFPLQHVALPASNSGGDDLPLVRGKYPEVVADAANDSRDSAQSVSIPTTINARFTGEGGEHWYKISLDKGQRLTAEIAAQRYLNSPIDTLLEIYDAGGDLVAQNDDGEIFASECVHDFTPFDSRLEMAAKMAGDYWIRVVEQTGARGPGCVYRLTLEETQPDFRLYQFPDAVPVWGPGSTATVCVEVTRLGGLKQDIELTVEGLPEGWRGSTCRSNFHEYRVPRGAFGAKSFLTITAPEDAKVGDLAEFRIVGRVVVEGRTVEHVAQPLTLYMWQEPNHFRASPTSRAAVGPKKHPTLTSPTETMEITPGKTIELPVAIEYPEGEKPGELSLTVNRGMTHFKCALRPPHKIPTGATSARVPLEISEKWQPGKTYSVVVALAWSSETRKGLPGPCTRLIHLQVPADAESAAGK